MTKWQLKGGVCMNIKVNGFRVGVMAAMLAIGGASCKRAPFKPMPKELISKRTEQVVDSFYNIGLELKNNPEYKCIYRDTVRFRDVYAEKPKKLQRFLTNQAVKDKYPTDENDFSYMNYIDPVYIVSSPIIFTRKNIFSKNVPYIAIEEYDLKRK